jgi:hypothetical protein
MLLNNRTLTFVFRCPHTGRDVHAWSEYDFETSPTYEPVTCFACLSVHWSIPRRDACSEATTTNKGGRFDLRNS